MKDMANCCLCSQIEGDAENDLIANLLPDQPYVRRVIEDRAGFVVIPSLGPVTDGHVLLCPKDHYRSFGEMPMEEVLSADVIRDSVRALLFEAYEQPVHIFEHGSARCGDRVVCTVEHAHLHFVPAEVDIISLLLSDHLEWLPVDAGLVGLRLEYSGCEYIYYESPTGMALLAQGKERCFESQYMRRILASAIGGMSEWNWRENPKPHATDAIFKTLSGADR